MYMSTEVEPTTYDSALETQIGLNQDEMGGSVFKRIAKGKSDSTDIARFHRTLSEAFDVFLVSFVLALFLPC